LGASGCLKYVTSGAGSAHDLASGALGTLVFVSAGVAGLLSVVLAFADERGHRATVLFLVLALAMGAAITAASSVVTTRATCTDVGRNRFEVSDWDSDRAGLPAYFSERVVEGDSGALWNTSALRAAVDGLFWAGSIGLLLGTWATGRRGRVV